MVKINFSKVENNFDLALRKIIINRLAELATIVTLIHDPNSNISSGDISDILKSFDQELLKLKKRDKKIYEALKLTLEEETKFKKPLNELTPEDWNALKELKEKIDVLKKDLYGEPKSTAKEDEERIEKERVRHINKRFNIRDHWLPLH